MFSVQLLTLWAMLVSSWYLAKADIEHHTLSRALQEASAWRPIIAFAPAALFIVADYPIAEVAWAVFQGLCSYFAIAFFGNCAVVARRWSCGETLLPLLGNPD